MSASVFNIFGIILAALMICAILIYYSKGRREELERPKYRMMEDDRD